jgi:hypothetical protein
LDYESDDVLTDEFVSPYNDIHSTCSDRIFYELHRLVHIKVSYIMPPFEESKEREAYLLQITILNLMQLMFAMFHFKYNQSLMKVVWLS